MLVKVGGGVVGERLFCGTGVCRPLTFGVNGSLPVGHLAVDGSLGIVRCNNRELIDRLIELVMRGNRAIVLLTHVVREGLGSTVFGGIPTLEFAQVIADGIKDQRLRIRARRRGRHSLETISFELCINPQTRA